jgi:hypothetical protein
MNLVSDRPDGLPVNRTSRSAHAQPCPSVSGHTALCASSLLLIIGFTLCTALPCPAKDHPAKLEPKLTSVFPWGGQRGTVIRAEVRGESLAGAYSVWFDAGSFKSRLLKVEEVPPDIPRQPIGTEPPKNPPHYYRVTMEVSIPASAATGVYDLRLVTPHGLTNSIRFPVLEQPVILEAPGSHQTIDDAQPITVPVIVNGRLSKPGELDYYSFHAHKSQELEFEAIPGENLGKIIVSDIFDPQLALFRPGGSWFDPRRPTQLLFDEQRNSTLIPVEAKGTYRFDADGEYFIQVSGMYGSGCLDCSYQLRIVPKQELSVLTAETHPVDKDWVERSFDRPLTDRWLMALNSRVGEAGTLSASLQKPATVAGVGSIDAGAIAETHAGSRPPLHPLEMVSTDATDSLHPPPLISIPSEIEGTIDHPGAVERYRFTVKPGEKLAFEIQTPEMQPPQFNPRFAVVDSQNHELFSSVHRSVSLFNANADRHPYLKAVDPKVLYTFEKGGEYVLRISDVTSRFGEPDFRYKLLVRPQVPHVGEVTISEGDHLNLIRGEAVKLTITTAYEEGFSGQLSFAFAGLPEGVQVSPGAELSDNKAPVDIDQQPDMVAPRLQKTTVIVLAQPNAPLTTVPRVVHVSCQPILDGKVGAKMEVHDIPVMVVSAAVSKEAAKPASGH